MASGVLIMSPANMNTSKRMASVLTEMNMFTIGMIANIVTMTKRKNAAILYLMMKMTTDPSC